MRCGLVGKKLAHSYSKRIHGMLGDYSYDLFEVEPDALEEFVRRGGMDGLNVTIPYKKTVLPWCDELSPAALQIGSVNTLVFGKDGSIRGHNTDYDGFLYLADSAGVDFAGKKVLVLGSGGTSLTVRQAVADRGAGEVIVVSRSGEHNYGNLDRHRDAQVIINTTPVGMYPDCAGVPVELDRFPMLSGVLDVVYNPLRTGLVRTAQRLGIPASGGLPMLVRQAAAAAELFTGKLLPAGKTEKVLRELEREITNIVLIGMPGSGKSSVGLEISRRLGREFVDTDALVEKKSRRKVQDIIAQDGEEAFRILEREAVREAGGRCGLVIATGGGAVLCPDNYSPLAQNGRIYFLRRDLLSLPTEGRPLSKDLASLYARRAPLYRSFADAQVDCGGGVLDASQKILEDFYETACY